MASITVTNLTDDYLVLHDAYTPIGPGASHTFTRFIHEVEHQRDLMALYRDGDIDLRITVSPDELLFRKLMDLTEVTRHWAYQTHQAAIPEYVGGFYEFASSDNDFDPAITFGAVNAAYGAHFLVVTGAVPVDEVTIQVTGTKINDNGERTAGAVETIVIPTGTPVNSYFETPMKWNGRLDVETIAGTAITCNYGFCKYHDFNNQDFEVLGLECLWDSDSTDSSSDIELLFHNATGWAFNAGSEPDSPAPLASRSGDYVTEVAHALGEGAWKRSNLTQRVDGKDSQGILWRVTSGNAGLGTLSFRTLSIELTIRKLPPGNL